MAQIEKVNALGCLKTAAVLFILLALITGVLYPLAVTMTGQILFLREAHGSLLYDGIGGTIGSRLIGQSFNGEKYFQPRPSATPDHPYNGLASSGSNLGPTNKILIDSILNRTEELKKAYGTDLVPSDMVMSSASGLDPDISLGSAKLQAGRVAKARGIDLEKVNKAIEGNTEKPIFGILGTNRVNTVTLNLELDRIADHG
jgi:K+-transporting ATPase ATPase C chain